MARFFTYTEAEEIRYNKMLFEALTDEEKEDVKLAWDMYDTELEQMERDAPSYFDMMPEWD